MLAARRLLSWRRCSLMKLLEAVLNTGNRMNVGTNRGDAQAFKLDTLLKLVDVRRLKSRNGWEISARIWKSRTPLDLSMSLLETEPKDVGKLSGGQDPVQNRQEQVEN
ncbi:hypothetical protein COP1_014145 [Malus domestica]